MSPTSKRGPQKTRKPKSLSRTELLRRIQSHSSDIYFCITAEERAKLVQQLCDDLPILLPIVYHERELLRIQRISDNVREVFDTATLEVEVDLIAAAAASNSLEAPSTKRARMSTDTDWASPYTRAVTKHFGKYCERWLAAHSEGLQDREQDRLVAMARAEADGELAEKAVTAFWVAIGLLSKSDPASDGVRATVPPYSPKTHPATPSVPAPRNYSRMMLLTPPADSAPSQSPGGEPSNTAATSPEHGDIDPFSGNDPSPSRSNTGSIMDQLQSCLAGIGAG